MSMSIMTFMSLDFWSNTFITVLNMSITASYVAIAILLARLLLKKLPKIFSYVLWSVVLFRLLCPVSFATPFSLLGLAHPTTPSNLSTFQYIPQEIGMMPVPTVDTGIASIDSALNGALPAATPLASANPLQIWLALGTLVWLTGMAALLIYAAISYYRLKKQISTATLVSANYLDFSNCGHYAQKIAGNLTSHVNETDRIRGPFVCGLLRPKIYLPLSLSPSEREYILCHELTHIRRRDYLLKPLAFFAVVLHWFNPLMWLCFALMTKDMEMSCDERVIREMSGDRNITGYSSSLLALATRKKMPSPIPLAFGESNVKARIKNILHYQKPVLGIIITAIIVVIGLAVVLLSNPSHGPSQYGYDLAFLLENKTPYLGNHVKVGALVNGMPLPAGVTRSTMELSTSQRPYGVTYRYILTDDKIKVSEAQFWRNSLLLFALIDNVDEITHLGYWQNKALSSTPFRFAYTRADAEKVVGGDIRQFAENEEKLAELIEIIQMLN